MASRANHKRALAERAGLCILAPHLGLGRRAGVLGVSRERRARWARGMGRDASTVPMAPSTPPVPLASSCLSREPRRVFTKAGICPPEGTSPMTRHPRDLTFRKNDAVRAIRAAITAGVPNPRIEIDRHGTISIISGMPVKNVGKPDALNEWDDVAQ